MNCLEFRRALGADPNHASAESLAHRAQCPNCEKYAQEMRHLNDLIKRALEVPVREAKPKAPRVRWYALAASVTLAIAAGGVIWFAGFPRTSIASDALAHLAHEPHTMTVSDQRISAELLDGALRAKGMRLKQPIEGVSYVQSCYVRGSFVPHLVVQTDRGPVTVILLTRDEVSAPENFDADRYHGVVVPLERGSAAVIATDPSVVETVANTVKASIAWN